MKTLLPSPLFSLSNSPAATRRWSALLALASLSAGAPLLAQPTNTWIRAESTGGDWNDITNWSAGAIPGADTLVQFNLTSLTSVSRVTFINFSTAPAGHAVGVRNVGAVSMLSTDTWGRIIRGTDNSSAGEGVLVLHGVDATLGGSPVRLLIANYTQDQLLAFRNGTGSIHTRVGLADTGVVYVAGENAIVEFGSTVEDVNGPHGMIKRGPGQLHFTSSSAQFFPTYSGGFTLEEGIVQWTTSGNATANPFGTGTLTLRGGTLRSSSTSGRNVYVPIVLDGNITFGSDNGTNTGFITVSSESGTFSTTLQSSSVLNNIGQLSWNQSIHGTGDLTKTGGGLFHITSINQSTFTGTLSALEGTMRLSGSLANSPLVVGTGARLEGLGAAYAGLTVASGATVSPGLDAEWGALTTGALTLQAGATLDLTLAFAATPDGYDSIIAEGPVSIDGAILALTLNFDPSDTDAFVLIDNRSGSPVNGVLTYGGVPQPEGSIITVTSGPFSKDFEITYAYAKQGYRNSVALIPPGSGSGGGNDYSSWRIDRFGNDTDPAGDPLAQTADQPVANLLVYALGLDLLNPPLIGLPRAEPDAVTFTRRADVQARLVVEATSDNPSGEWTEIATLEAGASSWSGLVDVSELPEADGLLRVRVVNTSPIPVSARLVRVRATLP